MMGPVNKTVLALMDIHPFTSQMWCSCASMVLLVVRGIWLDLSGQSPNLIKMIKI